MASFKEIVTKAIIGKGKKYFKNNYSISVSDNPTTVLGCWVINHKFKGYKSGEKITITDSKDYYAITRKLLTTTFNKNGATSIGTTTKTCY